MIDINAFETFLLNTFSASLIKIDNFKEDVKFIDVDCFADTAYKLTIALSTDDIRFAAIDKEPELDFSLYDFVFKTNEEGERFVLKIKKTGVYPFR